MDEKFTSDDVEKWVSVWPIDYGRAEQVEMISGPWVVFYLSAIVFLAVGLGWVGYQLIEFVSMVGAMGAYR